MTDLLTESFCERCGTRYEFGATEPLSRAQKTRGLVSGLRNFIMSTDSLTDAIGDAMQAEEQALAARQIDAFQETFSFCLECRRYTCTSCWNDSAGRCRTCEPVPGVDDLVGMDERLAHAAAAQAPPATPIEPAPGAPAASSWPDGEPAWPAAEPLPDAVIPPPGDEMDLSAVDGADESSATPGVVPGFASASSASQDLEPPEAPEAVPAEAPEPPETVPAAGQRDLRETHARGPLPPAAPPAAAVPVDQTARQSQLDILGIEDPGQGVVPVGQHDQLPYRSSGAGSTPAGVAALSAVWTASTRHLEAGARPATLRHCGGCGLTVSATARFCRRCGAPQALSA